MRARVRWLGGRLRRHVPYSMYARSKVTSSKPSWIRVSPIVCMSLDTASGVAAPRAAGLLAEASFSALSVDAYAETRNTEGK